MRAITTISEFGGYSIISYPEADVRVADDDILRLPLIINLGGNYFSEFLAQCDYYENVNADLRDSFADAATGRSTRWKLFHVLIAEHSLRLCFADAKSKNENGFYKEEYVQFSKYGISLRVFAERDGSDVPDRYDIQFVDESDVDIAEYRNNVWHSIAIIEKIEGGKYVMRYQCYD